MRTKIVYCIISSENDCYLEQLVLSIYSLRKKNNKVYIEVVTDNATCESLVGWRKALHSIVDYINIVEIPQKYNKVQCSRFLKTNLRNIVSGDFLFIDTDTVICSKLNGIDYFQGDILLVADCNGNVKLTENATIAKCQKAGFEDMANKPYFNSGVMLVKDTAANHEFYEQWFLNWEKSISNGVNLDQPALNYTNYKNGCIIRELDGGWNCQIYFNGWEYLSKSKILHYAGGGQNQRINEIYRIIRECGSNDPRLQTYLKYPRTRLYSYLTNNDMTFKSKLVVKCKIFFPFMYKMLTKH